MTTDDLDFPKTQESKLFALMWVNMFTHTTNEFNFMAEDAGIVGQITPNKDHIFISIDGYSDTIESYTQEFFSKLRTFDANEKVWNDLKEQQLVMFRNSKFKEPYQRLMNFFGSAISGENPDLDAQIKLLENFTFESFQQKRKNWLNNVNFEWLVEGHVLPDKAIEIGNQAASLVQKNQKKVNVAQVNQMAKVPEKTVYNYLEVNPVTQDKVNPNSAILSYFQYGEFNYHSSATLQVLMSLINEPAFD